MMVVMIIDACCDLRGGAQREGNTNHNDDDNFTDNDDDDDDDDEMTAPSASTLFIYLFYSFIYLFLNSLQVHYLRRWLKDRSIGLYLIYLFIYLFSNLARCTTCVGGSKTAPSASKTSTSDRSSTGDTTARVSTRRFRR